MNPGHEYIRHLRFINADDVYRNPPVTGGGSMAVQHARARQQLVQVLDKVKEDNLQSLSTPIHLPLTLEVLARLKKRQRQIQRLSLGPLPDDIMDRELRPDLWLKNLGHLTINDVLGRHGYPDLIFYGQALRYSEAIRSLTVLCNSLFVGYGNDIQVRPITLNREGVDETVFSCMQLGYTSNKAPLKLEGLIVSSDTALREPEKCGLEKLVNLMSLRCLSVADVPSTPEFLDWLAQGFTNSQAERSYNVPLLQCLRILGGGLDHTDIGLAAAALKLVNSFSGLKYLHLHDGTWHNFDIRVVQRHSTTLEHLCISLGSDRRDLIQGSSSKTLWRASPASLMLLMPRMQRLRQVVLDFPRISVTEKLHSGHLFALYLVSCSRD